MKSHLIFFPGSFKPFHDGHLDMIEKSLSSPDGIIDKEGLIIISSKDRDGIRCYSAKKFIDEILDSYKEKTENSLPAKAIVSSKKSPLGDCYHIAHREINGDNSKVFSLCRSSKDNDTMSEDFCKQIREYARSKNACKKLDYDQIPLLISSGKFKDEPVSSKICRDALIRNDFGQFKSCYEWMLEREIVSEEFLKKWFSIFKKEVDRKSNPLEEAFFNDKYNENNNIAFNKMTDNKHRMNESSLYDDVVRDTIKLNISSIANKHEDLDMDAMLEGLSEFAGDVKVKTATEADMETMKYVQPGDIIAYIINVDPRQLDEFLCDWGIDESSLEQFVLESKKNSGKKVNERLLLDDDSSTNEDDLDTIIQSLRDEDDEDPRFDNEEDPFTDVEASDEYDMIENPDEETYSDETLFEKKKPTSKLNQKNSMHEKRYSSLNPKCRLNENRTNRAIKAKKPSGMIRLDEALKCEDPAMQKKVTKSEDIINTIINDIKDKPASEIDAKMLKNAHKKLKKEIAVIKNAGCDPSKIKNLKKIIRMIAKEEPSALELTESQFAKLWTKARSNSLTLHDEVKVNGHSLIEMRLPELKKMKAAASKRLASLREDKDIVMNESASVNSEMKSNVLKKLGRAKKLFNILSEEIEYREFMLKRNGFLLENEEEKKDDFSFEAPAEKDEKPAESPETENPDEDEEVELSGIVFTMKDKAAADDFISACVDGGVPKEALEIVEDEDDEDDDKSANESARSAISKKFRALLEDDENQEEGANDEAPADENDENASDDDTDASVKVRLVDTDYTDKVAQVLDDVYGITREDFEEKLGGEIVSDEESEDADQDDDTEDISAEDLFKDL